MYRANCSDWDARTLSFVVCRSSDDEEDDRFYARLETDPLFCRKYIIRAKDTIDAQREELLRLPFLPLPTGGGVSLQRPQPAQDVLQSAGLSAALARNLVEPRRRSPEGIAIDLLGGDHALPEIVARGTSTGLTLTEPRTNSRLTALTVEAFRAYRDARTFDLDASVVVLYGPNGLGKTSFFDALDYACTGRIGRLCRTRRNQTDFSRIATHLDKTPGSGSVTVELKSGSADTPWKLQRSTGNWSTAWIDGEEADRKTVLNRLTHANWLDTTPRQQTLDSLFRATHLFGQDDQELLASFRTGSVIPEEFISEMLSLQDYSEGISKLEAVLSQLSRRRNELEQTLRALSQQRAMLSESLTEEPGNADGTPLPIEATLAALRQDSDSQVVDLAPLPGTPSVSAFEEWLDLAAAEVAASESRLSALQAIQDARPAHELRVREHRDAQQALAGFEQELLATEEEERALTANLRRDEDELQRQTGRRKDLRARVEALGLVEESLGQRIHLAQQMDLLAGERDRQIVARGELEAHLATTESAISDATAKIARLERDTAVHDTTLRRGQELIEDLPQFEADLSFDASTPSRRKVADEALKSATVAREAAEARVQAIRVEMESREDEYQRTITAKAEVDRLLTELHSHIDGETCPLCGTPFESAAALRAAVERERDASASPTNVLVVYPQLRNNERLAQDQIRVTSRDLEAAQLAIDELRRLQSAATDRLSRFRKRLAEFIDVDASDGRWTQMLGERQQELLDRLETSKRASDEVRRTLDELAATKSSLNAQREAVHSRVQDLSQKIRNIEEQVAAIDARIAQSLPGQTEAERELAALKAELSQELAEAETTWQALEEKVKRERDQGKMLADKMRAVAENRGASVEALNASRVELAAFEDQLQAQGLDVADAPDIETFTRATVERKARIDAAATRVRRLTAALVARDERARSERLRLDIQQLDAHLEKERQQRDRVESAERLCREADALLKRERQGSIERHIAAYGPMITMIQQRLRSVYGFGEVQLQAAGGEAKVHVEWRNKSMQVQPTDFFSDSQKQILMLSIFMAGGLRQNWSGFAPVLLDDPVTHFDDLNAYAFVELIRGIVATSPLEWQFIVSTCEQRLFDLMHRKFSHLPSGARFYEFVGMTSSGPIVERR
jgi:exonuclease SbcC